MSSEGPQIEIVDWSRESSGGGVLNKIVIRSDGSEETKTLDMDFTWEVDPETTKLPAMVAMFPAAETKMARARSGLGSYVETFKPADANIKLALLGFEKSAKVRQVVCRLTAKSSTVTARVRVLHVKPRSEGGELMYSHGSVVAISTKVAQQSMDFEAPGIDIGDVIYASVEGKDVCGKVTREGEPDHFVLADFGVSHLSVNKDDVVTIAKMDFGGYGSQEQFEQEFKVAAETAGKGASWQAILAALATMLGEGTVDRKPDGTWLMTQDVLVQALAVIGVEALPPEAAVSG